MRIGVISEGHADRALITNILTGITGIDSSDIEALRPVYMLDETDKANLDPLTFGGWNSVKAECESRNLIDGFLLIEGQDFIVIHIDSAEAEDYGIKRPDKKTSNYCEELRSLIVVQIKIWLKDDLSDKILFAIAIEEIDAWLLTVFDDKHDTSTTIKAKEKLQWVLCKKGIDTTSDYDNYLKLSKPFLKQRLIEKGKFLDRNCSLHAFFEEVQMKVIPKLGN